MGSSFWSPKGRVPRCATQQHQLANRGVPLCALRLVAFREEIVLATNLVRAATQHTYLASYWGSPTWNPLPHPKKKKRANIFRFCLRSIRLAEDRQVKALYLFILHIWYCFYSSTSSLSFSHLFLFFSRFLQSVPIPLLAYCNNLDAHVALSLFFFFISRVTRTLSACFY